MTQTTKSRREMLEGFVQSNPSDAFARYGLALECAKLGDDAAASEHFRQLLAAHPEYIAGYFQFGQFWRNSARFLRRGKLLRLVSRWLGKPAIRTRGMKCRRRFCAGMSTCDSTPDGILEIDL